MASDANTYNVILDISGCTSHSSLFLPVSGSLPGGVGGGRGHQSLGGLWWPNWSKINQFSQCYRLKTRLPISEGGPSRLAGCHNDRSLREAGGGPSHLYLVLRAWRRPEGGVGVGGRSGRVLEEGGGGTLL